MSGINGRWIAVLAVAAHLAAIPGAVLVTSIGRPRFFALFLTLLAGLLLFDLLLFVGRGGGDSAAAVSTQGRPVVADWRPTAAVILSGIVAVTLLGRGIAFYALMGIAYTLLLLRILVRGSGDVDRPRSAASDLALVCASSFTLIAAQVFTVAFYYGKSDTIIHTALVTEIVGRGSVGALEGTRYFWYSAFHLLSSVGVELTGLSPRLLTALSVGIIFQAALVTLFLFARRITGSQTLSLVGVTLVSFNVAFLGYGVQAHYQALSFVFFCFFLYLLFARSTLTRGLAILFIIFLTWTGTHHVSLLMSLTITAVPVAAWYVLDRWATGGDGTLSDGGPGWTAAPWLPFVTCGIIFTSYWVLVTVRIRSVITWIFFTSSAAEGGVSSFYSAVRYADFGDLLAASIPFFVDTVHFAILMAVAAVGTVAVLTSDRLQVRRWQVALAAFVPAAVFYFPNPLWVPLEGLAEFSRWRIMTLPFLVLLPALGLQHLYERTSRADARRAATVAVVFLLALTSLSSGLTNPSLVNLAGYEKDYQRYISTQEVDAVEFVESHRTEQRVHAYSDLPTYMKLRDGIPADGNVRSDSGPYDTVRVDAPSGRFAIDPGLTLVSTDALASHGIEVNVTNASEPGVPTALQDTEIVYASTVDWDRRAGSTIYSNGGVVVTYRPESAPPAQAA